MYNKSDQFSENDIWSFLYLSEKFWNFIFQSWELFLKILNCANTSGTIK